MVCPWDCCFYEDIFPYKQCNSLIAVEDESPLMCLRTEQSLNTSLCSWPDVKEALPGWSGKHIGDLSAVTEWDAEVLCGFSHAGLMPVHISDSFCSYSEILSRKTLAGVFHEFSASDACNGPVAVYGLLCVLSSQAQPPGMSLCGSVQKARGTWEASPLHNNSVKLQTCQI